MKEVSAVSRPEEGEKKRAARFDFVDAILAGALIIAVFIVLVGVFTTDPTVGAVLEVRLTEEQIGFYKEHALSPDAGAEVLDLESGEKIGTLYTKYEAGGETLQILVRTAQNEKNAVRCGEKISFTVGKMTVCGAQITDVRKEG